jgi:hypothetical protein
MIFIAVIACCIVYKLTLLMEKLSLILDPEATLAVLTACYLLKLKFSNQLNDALVVGPKLPDLFED